MFWTIILVLLFIAISPLLIVLAVGGIYGLVKAIPDLTKAAFHFMKAALIIIGLLLFYGLLSFI